MAKRIQDIKTPPKVVIENRTSLDSIPQPSAATDPEIADSTAETVQVRRSKHIVAPPDGAQKPEPNGTNEPAPVSTPEAEPQPTPEAESMPPKKDEQPTKPSPEPEKETKPAPPSEDDEETSEGEPTPATRKALQEAAEKAAKRERELKEYIESHQFYVPINAVARERSVKRSVGMTFGVVLLSIVLVDLMLDAGVIILLQKIPHTNFFNL